MTRLKEWLIYSFIFLLPWQTRLILRAGQLNGGYWEYGTMSLYVTEIVLWIIIVVSIIDALFVKFKIKNLKLKITIKSSKLFLLIGGLLLIGIVSAGRAFSPGLAFCWLGRAAEGAALFFIIKYSRVDFKKLVLVFAAGAVIQAGLGIWQFAAQSVLASKWLGMAGQDPSVLGTSVVESAAGRFLRAYGGLPHPNILGAYLALGIILICFSSFLIKQKKISNPLFAACYMLCVTCLFLSFSRAAWLAMAVALLFFIFCRFPVLSEQKRRGRTAALLCLGFFLILVFAFWPLSNARFDGGERLEAKSTMERISGYGQAWQIIKAHPVLGVGPGNYTLAVHQEIDASQPAWYYQPVHNVFLLILAETGVLGFLALAVLAAVWLVKKWRAKHATALLVSAVLFVLFCFDHFFWSLPLGIWLFWSIMAITSKAEI